MNFIEAVRELSESRAKAIRRPHWGYGAFHSTKNLELAYGFLRKKKTNTFTLRGEDALANDWEVIN